MNIKNITDKKELEIHFRKNITLNLYQTGDLDNFFYKHTRFFGLERDGILRQVVLIYNGTELPVLIALCDEDTDDMKYLIQGIAKEMPLKFYSHISKGLIGEFEKNYNYNFHGKYLKMILDKENFKKPESDNNTRRLNISDIEMIMEFYKNSYPDNWFDKRMLETGKYFGYFENGKLLGISGIHVYSEEYRIAVLGNIATDPDYRGRSICEKVTSALCGDLFLKVSDIGLNVHDTNTAAIRSYGKCGFTERHSYEEYMFIKKEY